MQYKFLNFFYFGFLTFYIFRFVWHYCRGVYKYDSVDSVFCHIAYIGPTGTRVFCQYLRTYGR